MFSEASWFGTIVLATNRKARNRSRGGEKRRGDLAFEVRVVDRRARGHHRKQKPHCIDRDLPLSAHDVFASVIAFAKHGQNRFASPVVALRSEVLVDGTLRR
jgi:hypothetical protein